ncbi:MAG: hypothetical protein A3D64_02225 [Candidatus Wildermuthbacteria bacterium RIFCSPHIGHO2_02_FULL_49_9]|uniref:Uncharacterized protein n=2 Tax=Candidatus Wildermuthiibacteriota TaxID=1817923 RepID=A0A1G2QXH0_9BACT|nr:MAG: hypothetical protein A2672_01810 [Candidatus Wildermuthbacteria bacterium RIFCSPHIGHO2_01_FULL_49_22b]OHA70397.1 MAG: hypothetical protein A3D64_02225 [Candidatus Wildermuthbacteria bacterium RIFCSPHIGHO2_02_FULL_49_9]
MEIMILAGFGGGVIRGLMGFVKHKYSYKEVSFSLPSFLSTVAISGGVGVATALTVRELGLEFLGSSVLTPAMALIVGYAGGDLIENIWKIITKNPELYSFKKK